MTISDPAAFAGPAPRVLTRRGLLAGGLGLVGAGTILPTSAYAAMQAANDLVMTEYRLSPPAWPKGQSLTVTVVADLHAGRPEYGPPAGAPGRRRRQ